MDFALTGRIADIPQEQFDRLDPAVGVVDCYEKVKQREADGRWRVTYLHVTDGDQTKAAIPLYASQSPDWSDPAYDPRTWPLPAAVREDCTANRCLVVESYEDRCSGLHVECSAREPRQLRQIMTVMARVAAEQDRCLSFPYFSSAAKDVLSAAAGGRMAWARLGREAQIRDMADPGWENSQPKRVRYNLRHDRDLIASAAITSGQCSWPEIEDTASDLIAAHNVRKGQPDHPEFVRMRHRQWADCPQAELVVFTARSAAVTGVETAVLWNNDIDLREIGLAGDEGADRRAAYLDLVFRQPILFAQSRRLQRIRLGMGAEMVKSGRGAVLRDLHGGVLTASDARRIADEHFQ